MNSRSFRTVLVVAASLALATGVHAKLPLEHVVISASGLAEAIDLTDRDTLELSNPWHGAIVGADAGPIAAPAASQPVYEITMHARTRGGELRPIYRVRYALAKDGAGLVYLPGRGEPEYTRNARTIVRHGQDGHWLQAAPEWDARMRAALAR